jgi:hypothetical protein
MYELDHMLNGEESRNHLQELVEQAKLAKLAHQAEDAEVANHNRNHKAAASQHSFLTSVILTLTRGA